jgi:hypothetical protein
MSEVVPNYSQNVVAENPFTECVVFCGKGAGETDLPRAERLDEEGNKTDNFLVSRIV